METCKKIKNAIVVLIARNFPKVEQIVRGILRSVINQTREISQFNQMYEKDFEIFLKDAIKKNIISDFYSNEFQRMVSEVN